MSEHAGKPHDVDRSRWPAGPWDREPDRADWRTRAGLHAIALRNPSGFWCGYVGVPPKHPALEKYRGDDADLDVHGGITYGPTACRGNVCHLAPAGEPDELHWYGFDCAHLGDLWPKDLVIARDLGPEFAKAGGYAREGEYRSLAFVRRQCEALARQLAGAS